MLVQNIDINNKSISIVHFFSMSKLNANDPTHIHMHRKRQLQKKTYVHVGAEDMKREIYHPLNVFPEKVGLRTRLESMKDGM